MTNVIQPLLAKKADYEKIQYPVLATPKLDGIRCLMVEGVAMSRTMKPIPNQFVQEELAGLNGLDGELMVKGDFNAVSSAIMSRDGEPDFFFHVFDMWDRAVEFDPDEPEKPFGYAGRLQYLEDEELDWHPRVEILKPVQINNEEELEAYLDKCVNEGYEGIMLRDPTGKYKHGRSTVKEGILLKVKRFFDDEATLVEIIEKMTNTNELERDELGHAKRSSAKDGQVPADTSGSCVMDWNGVQFKVGFGPGFTDAIKKEMWDNRENLYGRLYKFSYQELSRDGIPRFGKLLGERHKDDL